MSQHSHEKNIIPRSLKYPLFFLGLLVIIGGVLGAQQLKLPLDAEIAAAVAGSVILVLGIVLE